MLFYRLTVLVGRCLTKSPWNIDAFWDFLATHTSVAITLYIKELKLYGADDWASYRDRPMLSPRGLAFVLSKLPSVHMLQLNALELQQRQFYTWDKQSAAYDDPTPRPPWELSLTDVRI